MACACDTSTTGLIGCFPCGQPGCGWGVTITPEQEAKHRADYEARIQARIAAK
jgi:hypothetical protein